MKIISSLASIFQMQPLSKRYISKIKFNNYVQKAEYHKGTFLRQGIKYDEKGKTLFHLAVEKMESIEVIRELLNLGYFVDIRDFEGNTPLMLAVRNPDTPIDIINFLINHGADVQNYPNKKGDTVENIAISTGPKMVDIVNKALHKYRGFPKNHITFST